jgi:Tol biopolymer transport system component
MTKLQPCIALAVALTFLSCSTASKSGNYKIALVPARTGQHGIFVINSDATGGKLLTSDTTAQLRASSWSPNGKKIAFFSIRRNDSDILEKYKIPLHLPLYGMDAGGSNQTRLLDFPVSSFAWSPDSRQLLVVSAYEDPARDDREIKSGKRLPMSAVYLLNLQTGVQRRVTGFGQNCYGAWSSDGTRVALSFGNEQNAEIYSASIDGKHTRRLDDTQAKNIKPVWSPDSKKIAYISVSSPAEGGTAAAYVVNADGTDSKRLNETNVQEVSWAPDGKHLLIQTAGWLSLTEVNNNKSVKLTGGVIEPRDGVFTPDGTEVMFRSDHEGEWHLYAVDVKSAKVRRITGRLSASMFCLSPLF